VSASQAAFQNQPARTGSASQCGHKEIRILNDPHQSNLLSLAIAVKFIYHSDDTLFNESCGVQIVFSVTQESDGGYVAECLSHDPFKVEGFAALPRPLGAE
jgi:hypothetical protein